MDVGSKVKLNDADRRALRGRKVDVFEVVAFESMGGVEWVRLSDPTRPSEKPWLWPVRGVVEVAK